MPPRSLSRLSWTVKPPLSLRRRSISPWLAALRLCLDRILPPRKDRPVTFTLPPIESAQTAAMTISAVLAAVAAGDITPADAGEISKLIEAYVKAFETARTGRTCGAPGKHEAAMNIEARIGKLERVLAPSQDHRWHQVTGSSVECEAAREAMIASGQATRSDRFVYRVIVTPAQSLFMQATSIIR